MEKLCFLSSMSSSEWASWVQAFGSIAAILGAAGIAIWQSREQHKNSLLLIHTENKLSQIERAKTILSLSKNCSNLVAHYSTKFSDRDVMCKISERRIYFDLNELKIIENAVVSISLESLPHQLVSLTLMVSSTVRQCRENIEEVLRCYREIDATQFNDFHNVLLQMQSSIKLTCADLEKEIEKMKLA